MPDPRFCSAYPIGTIIPLRRKGQPQMAVLHALGPHADEWRIHAGTDPTRGYVYSESFRYVTEHRIDQE